MIMTSAMKLMVPGTPIEAIQPMTKQPEINGMRFESPPSEGMSLVWVWSYTHPAMAKSMPVAMAWANIYITAPVKLM